MPKVVADFLEAESLRQHATGTGMPQSMRPHLGAINTNGTQTVLHDGVQALGQDGLARGLERDEGPVPR